MSTSPTPRQMWRDEIWNADGLTASQKLVALVFEKFAGRGVGSVFATRAELIRLTSLSRTTVIACVKALVERGYLVEVEPARQHRSTRYRLETPRRGSFPAPLDSTSGTAPDPLSKPRGSSSVISRPPPVVRGSRADPKSLEQGINHDPAREELFSILRASGIPEVSMTRVVEISADPKFGTVYPFARLLKDPQHRAACIAIWRAEADVATQQHRDAEPRCEQHDGEVARSCRTCLSEVNGDPFRPPESVGKRWYPDEVSGST